MIRKTLVLANFLRTAYFSQSFLLWAHCCPEETPQKHTANKNLDKFKRAAFQQNRHI